MGAWVSYGLGSLTDNLPAFVVLPDSRGFAPNGPANWSAGFLPAAHQGTMIRPGAQEPDLRPLSAGRRQRHARTSEADGLALLDKLNREPPGDARRATRGSTPASPPTSWRPGCS